MSESIKLIYRILKILERFSEGLISPPENLKVSMLMIMNGMKMEH